jgi:hypothetical protein
MIERLVDIPGAFTNEIGDLLPGFILSTSDRDAFALALKNGQKRPQTIIVELMATTDPTKPWYNYYRNKPGVGATLGERFMNNIYADLFPGLGINPATELHPTTYSNQLALANGTDAQRQSLVANLVNGATVTYYSAGYPNGKLTTNFKTHFVNLAYNKFLGRNPTSTELSAAVTSMGAVLVANSIQGTEWVYWRIMSGKPYFEQQSQTGGPDGGLHTNRAWAESVIQDRIRPLADQIDPGTGQLELDSFSQKVLSKFSTQRAAFVKSVIFSASYRTIKINEYYQLVHGRLPTASEMSAWQNALATGSTYPGLISARLGNAEYFTAHTIPSSTPAQKNLQWANAVYQTLLNRAASGPEANALAGKIATLGRAGAAASVINGFPNAVPALNFEYRQKIVKEYFQTLLGRDPSGLEMDGYLNFLKTNRWEFVVVDMLANGLAVIPGSPPTKVATGLPREFWEVVT